MNTIVQENSLRVWWIPQIPMKSFYVSVKDIEQAKLILDTLGAYDIFQYKNKIKPDYSNVGGLQIYQNGEWIDWEDEEGNDIDNVEVSK